MPFLLKMIVNNPVKFSELPTKYSEMQVISDIKNN